MSTAEPFWKRKSLEEMSDQEWEALCDGCGRCCLLKFEDEDTGKVLYTDISCKLLNTNSCRCRDYENRTKRVPTCMDLKHADLADYKYLPKTCAYRLLSEGLPLFDWHPLISGRPESVIEAGISIKGRTISEEHIHPDELASRSID